MDLGLAGVGVQTGLKFELEGTATAGFDARAKFTYARKRTANGVMAMHTIGDRTFNTNMREFSFQDNNPDDSAPAKLDFSVTAHASVTLQPKFTLGLWANIDVSALSIDAEFYVKMWVDLEARADFQFRVRVAAGVGAEGIVPAISLDACNQAMLGCYDSDNTDSHQVCNHVHDTQLSFRLSAKIHAAYKVYAKAGWGNAAAVEHCSNKMQNDQCGDTVIDHGIPDVVLQVAYFCWYLTESCPAIANGRCGAQSCDQLLGQPLGSGLLGDQANGIGAVTGGGYTCENLKTDYGCRCDGCDCTMPPPPLPPPSAPSPPPLEMPAPPPPP